MKNKKKKKKQGDDGAGWEVYKGAQLFSFETHFKGLGFCQEKWAHYENGCAPSKFPSFGRERLTLWTVDSTSETRERFCWGPLNMREAR